MSDTPQETALTVSADGSDISVATRRRARRAARVRERHGAPDAARRPGP